MANAPAALSRDAAYGALLGALVGDAAGGVLEFMGRRPSHQEVEQAMRMPGGGVWSLGPGQITDDTELALCLAQALMEHSPSGALPLDDVAWWYGHWIDSKPFDIGITTQNALTAAAGAAKGSRGLAASMLKRASNSNMESKANGALMRVMPMAVWAHRLSDAQICDFAAADALLSHPNDACQAASAAYCVAIAHLIRCPGDAEGALNSAAAALESIGQAEVSAWFADSRDAPLPDVEEMAGFVRWAFFLAFRHLRLRSSYEAAMHQVLSMGGDVDTNAAIVGGLLGALHGAASIPAYMAAPVLARTVGCAGQQRPDFLQSSVLPDVFERLYAQATSIEYEG